MDTATMRSVFKTKPMRGKSKVYVVKYGLGYYSPNPLPHFSVTVDAPDTYNVTTGCAHDDVLKKYPDMQDIVDLHRSDVYGVPMYPVANSWYWFTSYDGRGIETYAHQRFHTMTPQQRAEKYLRAPAGYLDDMPTFRMMGGDYSYPAEYVAKVEALRPVWKAEADHVIAKYGLEGWEG